MPSIAKLLQGETQQSSPMVWRSQATRRAHMIILHPHIESSFRGAMAYCEAEVQAKAAGMADTMLEHQVPA